jgi:uncharacterized protein (DUF3820 family)
MEDEKNIKISIEELGKTVMPFGKYKDKTFEEIFNDGDYLEWLSKQTDGRNNEIKAKAKEFINMKQEAGYEKSNLQDLARAIVKRRNELKDSGTKFKDPLKGGHWY